MKLTFCFPEGKKKALTFSYDDGAKPDERLIEIFNRHNMKATFNLNAARYQEEPEKNAAYLKQLYAGHEIACHGKTHPFFERITQMSLVEDILEDRRMLEELTGRIVNGMAYPYGTYDSNVLQTLRSLGIVYSRTVKSTGKFGFPDDFLEWNPTCHHRENIAELADRLLATPYLSLCYVWGHSFEFDRNNDWHIIEDFCAKLADKEDIWYATNMEIHDYITAFRRLVTSADSHIVRNPSAQTVWLLDWNNMVLELKGGSEMFLA